MSVLAPLYFLGLAAVGLPILFHLIRRTPRGRTQFSSLIFLSPSPPRLTRRSRIENWLLLLLRGLVLALLVLAFCRPFLRQIANLSLDGVRGRRVAILVDTSAGMTRDGVWLAAMERLDHVLRNLDVDDRTALYRFDESVSVVVPFSDALHRSDSNERRMIKSRAGELSPSHFATDLGTAMTTIAEELATTNNDEQLTAAAQMVVITDLQAGSDLQALQDFEWPEDVMVAVEIVAPADPTNATLSLLQSDDSEAADEKARVRVANATDSEIDQFYVAWASGRIAEGDEEVSDAATVPVYVPPGQSRVVRIPRPVEDDSSSENELDRLILTGDSATFDNTFYVVPRTQDQVRVLYVGDHADDDPEGLSYYLHLALGETPERLIDVANCRPDAVQDSLVDDFRLVVVSHALPDTGYAELNTYIRNGGTALFVPADTNAAQSLAQRFDDFIPVVENTGTSQHTDDRSQYCLLVDIDFGQPLFKPFATPRYSDFTKVHFWNHRRFEMISEHSATLLASFDNGDPALWRQTMGSGDVYVLAGGWHPADSQLALSTKFVPLLNTLLDQAAGSPPDLPAFLVGSSVPVPESEQEFEVVLPSGEAIELSNDAKVFRGTKHPGIYAFRRPDVSDPSGRTPAEPIRFAVNLDPRESETERMDIEQLSQLGVQLGEHRTQAEESEHRRQLRDIELESQQQLWRWLIVAAIGVLGVETWLAGRASRQRNDSTTQGVST